MKSIVKRIFFLLAALMLCVMFVLNASAAAAASADVGESSPAVTASSGSDVSETLPDGVVQEDDMLIDLRLTTTLIVVICSVLALGVVTVTVILAKRNRK